MLHWNLQTLMVPFFSSLSNNLPCPTTKNVRLWLINPEHLLPFFCTPISMFSSIFEVLFPFSHQRFWLFASNSSIKTSSGQISLDSKSVYLVPTGFCKFWTDATIGHLLISKGIEGDMSLISCIKFPWSTTAFCLFLCAFLKKLGHLIQKPQSAYKIPGWKRSCW